MHDSLNINDHTLLLFLQLKNLMSCLPHFESENFWTWNIILSLYEKYKTVYFMLGRYCSAHYPNKQACTILVDAVIMLNVSTMHATHAIQKQSLQD